MKLTTTKCRNVPIYLRQISENLFEIDTQYSNPEYNHYITGNLLLWNGEPTTLFLTDSCTYAGLYQGYVYHYELNIYRE